MNQTIEKHRLVTIWHTYGPYHLARARALEGEFGKGSVICFSHLSQDVITYPFFNLAPESHQVITEGDFDIRFFPACWNTYRLLKKFRPHLILTCGYERPETLGALIYSRIFRKTIFLMLDNQYDDRKRSALVELVKRVYLLFFDGFIYGGDTHKDYLRILRVPPKREVYGYNCVDNESIRHAAEAVKSNGARSAPFDKYFLCVTRLVEKKNLPLVLSAYNEYKRSLGPEESPWGIVVVGEGPMRAILENQIINLALRDNVHLAGRVDIFEDVVNYYAYAKVVILASHHDEQWGLVVNEAMAAGRPVIVSKQCGCASSLVEERVNGFTFDPMRPDELAKHMVWMHDNETELEEMGRRSFEIVQMYSTDNFARNVQELYQRVSRNNFQ